METIGEETSKLVIVTENVISIFKDDEEGAMDAGQCIADHVRTLVRESRGSELMSLIYSDPFTRLLRLLSEKENQNKITNSDNSEVSPP